MKPRRVTILRKGLLVLALPLAYQALFIGLLMKRQSDHHQSLHWVVHTKDVLMQTDTVYRMLLTSQSNLRAYMLTKDELFTRELAQGSQTIAAELGKLEHMVSDHPKQRDRFTRVFEKARARLDYESWIVGLSKNGEQERVQQELQNLTGQAIMEALSEEIALFRDSEEKLDAERLTALQRSNQTQNSLLLAGLLVNVGIGALAANMFSREISSRIQVVTENTQRISRGEALPSLITGSDEIRELDEQFHLLADHLKSAQLRERIYQEALERRAEELSRANLDLEQKNQEIETFVYSVSHDLRSPLVNLQGFSRELDMARSELDLLLASDLTPEAQRRARVLSQRDMPESVQFIQAAVTRLSHIIDALLRLSRAGRVEYRPELVEVGQVITRIVEAMRGTISTHRAEVSIRPLPSVWADPTALEQIFANLIGNAVNYLDPERPGKIEIGVIERKVDGNEDPVTLYVKDNGLGIAEAYLPKVFAIFQRLHSDVAAGEGVGLALVRRVVERHGGKVWVESTQGVGSTFFVSLPVASSSSPLPVVAPRKERLHSTISHVH